MSLDLESLGFTKEELRERVIGAVVERILKEQAGSWEEDGDVTLDSKLSQSLHDAIRKRIDRAVQRIGDEKVAPMVQGIVEGIVLQKTNEWGERKGASIGFVEYLVQRAEAYLREPVDSDGKSQTDARESGRSYYGDKTTRISFMVNKHLHYSIETAMKQALETANKHIVGGIEEAVKMRLSELTAALTLSVKVDKKGR